MKIKDALITCINGMDNNESLYGAFALRISLKTWRSYKFTQQRDC